MGSAYDPEAGVLRLRHATLSVLARLAADPTDASLHDHDVAPLVAELRALGILSARGIDPEVAPLAEAVGSARRTFLLEADDHGAVRRYRGWLAPRLGVVAAQVPGTDDHELMADAPAMIPSLLGELVGLGAAPEPPVEGSRVVGAEALAALVARGPAASGEDAARVLGSGGSGGGWAEALAAAVGGASLRWRLTVGPDWLEVLDAGRSGLWLVEPADGTRARVAPTTPAAVRARLQALL